MKLLTQISLVLVIVLVSLSAYLRLAHSGIGCADWPACYGRIGEIPETTQVISAEDAYRKLIDEDSQALSWATPLHRLVASVLGLFVFALVVVSVRQKRHRLASFTLLALTVYLAVLGIRSGSLHDPAVVMGNLAGGFCMLGVLGWMVFSSGHRYGGALYLRLMTATAILVLSLQILMGGLTSANFAANSCRTLPDCHGSWWPGNALAKAVDLSRKHEVTSSGQAIGGEERIAIHKAHRLGAILAALLILAAAIAALTGGRPYRVTAIAVLVLLTAEFLIGVTAILSSLPIGLAVAHNWFAGLLLLALLRLLAQETGGEDS